MKRILFLCSGNYYRSRFAEIYFNWQAEIRGLSWRAESRGLAIDARNPGPISRHTAERLSQLGVSYAEYLRFPQSVTEADLARADHVVAVKEAEHRAMIAAHFPEWVDRVEYWHVDDLDCATSEEALSHLENEVLILLSALSSQAA